MVRSLIRPDKQTRSEGRESENAHCEIADLVQLRNSSKIEWLVTVPEEWLLPVL